jgi:hypothetical protein
VLTEAVFPHFAGQGDRVNRDLLLAPEGLTKILQRFGHRMPTASAGRFRAKDAAADHGGRRWLRKFFSMRPSEGNPIPGPCPSNRRLRQFRRFDHVFPRPGLLIGNPLTGFWVTPLRAEWHGASERPRPGDQLLFVFRLVYPDGQQGDAGFVDRWREGDGFCRLHIYPDGRVASNEGYAHQRLNHDVFRTLMGLLLLLEAIPAAGALMGALHPTADLPSPATIRETAGAPVVQTDDQAPFNLIRLRERQFTNLAITKTERSVRCFSR